MSQARKVSPNTGCEFVIRKDFLPYILRILVSEYFLPGKVERRERWYPAVFGRDYWLLYVQHGLDSHDGKGVFLSFFPSFLRSGLEGGGNRVFSFHFLRLPFGASAWKAFFLFSFFPI